MKRFAWCTVGIGAAVYGIYLMRSYRDATGMLGTWWLVGALLTEAGGFILLWCYLLHMRP